MNEVLRQVVLVFLTVVLATVVLVPTFLILRLLLDAGLDVALPTVALFGLVLAYLLR